MANPEPEENSPHPKTLPREEDALAYLSAAIERDLIEHPPDALFDASSRFYTVLLGLDADPAWPTHRARLILGLGSGIYQRAGGRIIRKRAAENRPKLLVKKGYEHMQPWVDGRAGPVEIEKATPEQKLESTTQLRKRVRGYEYGRIKPEKLKGLKLRLAQEEKFDRRSASAQSSGEAAGARHATAPFQAGIAHDFGKDQGRQKGQARPEALEPRINNLSYFFHSAFCPTGDTLTGLGHPMAKKKPGKNSSDVESITCVFCTLWPRSHSHPI